MTPSLYVAELAAELGVQASSLYALERKGVVRFSRYRGRVSLGHAAAEVIRAHFAQHLTPENASAWLTRGQVAELWGCLPEKVWRTRRRLVGQGHTIETRRVAGLGGRAMRYHRQQVVAARTALGPRRLPSYSGRLQSGELAQLLGLTVGSVSQMVRRGLPAVPDTQGHFWIRPAEALRWLAARPAAASQRHALRLSRHLGQAVPLTRPQMQAQLLELARAHPGQSIPWYARQMGRPIASLHRAVHRLAKAGLVSLERTPHHGRTWQFTVHLLDQASAA